MIHTARTVRTLQAIAMTVGFAVFLWSTGLPTLFRFAEAASITSASDTLSNSAPSTVSNHTISFTTPNGLVIGQSIQLTFPGTFTLGTIGEDDVDILVNNSSSSTVPGASGVGTWGVATSTNTITFTTPTDSGVASATPITIRIGTNAVDFGTGSHRILNPAATTSYQISIGGTMQDSGDVRVAIVDQVTVSASVDTSLTFTVTGVASGQTVNSSPTTTSTTTSSISIPFGTLVANTSRTAAQDLSVTTNATNGYTVTVEQTGALQSTTGAIIDGFIDGSNTATPTAWIKPSALVSDILTYGHWGLTSTDGTTTRSAQFGADLWVSGSTTPVVVMGHTGPADGSTAGVGAARIGYQIQISSLQEAGIDYTTTLRYIATPTF